jgi:hypothetical protein
MTTLRGILYLILFLPSVLANKQLEKYKARPFFELNDHQTNHYEYLERVTDKKDADTNMLLAKGALINGQIDKAIIFLNRISDYDKQNYPIKKRYLSTIYFIKGQYQKSLNNIKHINYTSVSAYREICLLKLINYMALQKSSLYAREVTFCQLAIKDDSIRTSFWLKQFTLLSTNKNKILNYNYLDTIRDLNNDPDYTTMWLKLALYLNKEKEITKIISRLPLEAYESQKNRELIAFAYYRTGNIKMAKEFISDIESPNADNIRGNISLNEGKPEIAFGHYQLALQKKDNSLNALKRSIPLAWQLGLWKEAQTLLDKIQEEDIDQRKKLALQAALTIRDLDLPKAKRNLRLLEYQYDNHGPIEVNLMNSYLGLLEQKPDVVKKYADKACKGFDGLNCYLQFKNLTIENIGKLITQKESPFSYTEFEVDKLKEVTKYSPLREAKYIDQKDIEELDSLDLERSINRINK